MFAPVTKGTKGWVVLLAVNPIKMVTATCSSDSKFSFRKTQKNRDQEQKNE